MKVKILKVNNDWPGVVNTARRTMRRPATHHKDVTIAKKKAWLLSEHSPIRNLTVQWQWIGIPYWVSMQLRTHKIGIEHFVTTQRSDRTGVDRSMLPQGALVNHECTANYQAIINISRRRLCGQASIETSAVWQDFLNVIRKHDEVLWSVCVPNCVYRGFCPELKSCGYVELYGYSEDVKRYRKR